MLLRLPTLLVLVIFVTAALGPGLPCGATGGCGMADSAGEEGAIYLHLKSPHPGRAGPAGPAHSADCMAAPQGTCVPGASPPPLAFLNLGLIGHPRSAHHASLYPLVALSVPEQPPKL